MAVASTRGAEAAGPTLGQLRAFVELGEELHFGRTARRLGVSQSSLSETIRRLEDHLGSVLLERTTRRVTLTEAGSDLLPRAWDVLERVESMRSPRAGTSPPSEVFRIGLPFLRKIRSLGCHTLVECTPAYIGRDPRLLRQLSEASGLNLLTNTGYYGAADDKFVPRHAYEETAEQLAGRWTREFYEGIEDTGIKIGRAHV